MRITYSQIESEFREPIEKECMRHIEKLGRLLKHYAGDSIQLHVTLERLQRTAEFKVSLTLTLPNAGLHATASGLDVRKSAKGGFAELESQLKKHQEKLRKDHVWKRKRKREALKVSEVLPAD